MPTYPTYTSHKRKIRKRTTTKKSKIHANNTNKCKTFIWNILHKDLNTMEKCQVPFLPLTSTPTGAFFQKTTGPTPYISSMYLL